MDSFSPLESEDIPWAPPRKALADSKVALVTTAGIHHRHQTPFEMNDPDGDPSFRMIDVSQGIDTLMITHDYYDHTDADKDLNIVFPIERLHELRSEGLIREVSQLAIGFMGHITGPHISTLIHETAQKAAGLLKAEGVDVVLLTPG